MYHPPFKKPSEGAYRPLAKLLVGLSAALLTGCATRVEVVRELPPPELLRECPAPPVDLRTSGGLALGLLSYHDALARCNIDKKALRDWAEE